MSIQQSDIVNFGNGIIGNDTFDIWRKKTNKLKVEIDAIDTALSNKADIGHTHSEFALATHNHDGTYAALSHGHAISDITNLQTTLNSKIGETEINTAHFVFSNNTLQLKTIQEGQIASDAITTLKIDDQAVTNDKIALNTIQADRIAPGAVDSSEIADGAVDFEHLNAGDVVTSSEGIGNNNTNFKIPTSGAVKSFVDNSLTAAFSLSGTVLTITV